MTYYYPLTHVDGAAHHVRHQGHSVVYLTDGGAAGAPPAIFADDHEHKTASQD